MVQASASAETNPDVASIFDTLKYPHPDSHTYGMYHPSAWGSYRTISRYKNDEVTKVLEQARATVERDAPARALQAEPGAGRPDYPSIFVANPVHHRVPRLRQGLPLRRAPRLRRGVLRLHHRQEVAPSVRGRRPRRSLARGTSSAG